MRRATAPGTCASCGSSTKIHTGAPQLLNPCYCLSDESDRDEGNSVRMMKAKKVNWGGATTTNAGGKVTSVNPGLAAESSENSNTSYPAPIGKNASAWIEEMFQAMIREDKFSADQTPAPSYLCTRTSVSEQAAKENHRGSATINLPSRTTPCWKLQAGRGGRSERSKRFDSKLVDTYFDDVGGMAKILREFLLHVKHPECRLRVDLCSGQTLLSHAIAGQLKIGLATKLVAEVSSEL
ncbi:hypothetical protein pipiens_013777 [Culex pipiens pipiens]|uniref:Uncharacterized protein n=1 Tax=Culex pipiens pipiens TaxID=38569 RepID=A0ABD1CX34_CULPP